LLSAGSTSSASWTDWQITTQRFVTHHAPRQCFVDGAELSAIGAKVTRRHARYSTQIGGINSSQICEFITTKGL